MNKSKPKRVRHYLIVNKETHEIFMGYKDKNNVDRTATVLDECLAESQQFQSIKKEVEEWKAKTD